VLSRRAPVSRAEKPRNRLTRATALTYIIGPYVSCGGASLVKRNPAVALVLALGLLASTVATVGPVFAAQALTLDEFFDAALKRSDVVATQAELIRQAEERYKQANSTLYPTVSGFASHFRQEAIPTGQSGNSNISNRETITGVSATQPLFRGFRDLAALRQNKALIGAQNQDYLSARIQLFKDVVRNFYTILLLEQDLRNFDVEIGLNLDREKELNARVRIGRSRISEVLTVQATISTLRAQEEQLRGQLSVTRQAFAFLSGLDPATTLRDTENPPPAVEPVDAYLAQLSMRPDVKAAQQRLTASQENVTVARGAYLPSVDLSANRYLNRTGPLHDSDWDVGIALSVPIYTGGLLQSQVREATSQQTQAELTLSQIRRQAEEEIRSAYQSVVYDQLQLVATEKATEASRKNYEAQRHDYRLGLVTNLDVLQALTSFQQNQRSLDLARYTAKLDYLTLQAAAARRPAPPEDGPP
jgi:outer membrane protein